MSGEGALPMFTNAAHFQVVSEDSFKDTYIYNLDCIGNYQTNTISSILDRRLIKTLRLLRLELAGLLTAKFPDYQQILNCVSKKEHIDQIISLTKGLARNEPNEDLNTVYRVQREPLVPGDLSVLDTDTLKLLLTEQRNENIFLRDRLALVESRQADYEDLKERLVSCEAHLELSVEQTQPNESTDQTSPVTDSIVDNSILPPTSNESLPSEVRHPKPEPKTTQVYIGNVETSFTPENLMDYINTVKKVDVKLTDIQVLPLKGNGTGKAFNVKVPLEKLNQVISNWPEKIKAAKYVSKPKSPVTRPLRVTNGDRHLNRDQ